MRDKLNQLERLLPEGLIVDAAWLGTHGYSNSLRAKYVAAGRLEQPARRVYRRPRGTLGWQATVLSMQTLLAYPLVIAGRTALELQGFSHYLRQDTGEVHLAGPTKPPTWLDDLPLGVDFHYHNSSRLFPGERLAASQHNPPVSTPDREAWAQNGVTGIPLGHWENLLLVSTPERALLELLDELPGRESFDQVDRLFEGAANLSPRRLHRLLAACGSVKVKRLFFVFADRHRHAWVARLDRDAIELGSGNRMLVKGGRLDPTYRITVPQDF